MTIISKGSKGIQSGSRSRAFTNYPTLRGNNPFREAFSHVVRHEQSLNQGRRKYVFMRRKAGLSQSTFFQSRFSKRKPGDPYQGSASNSPNSPCRPEIGACSSAEICETVFCTTASTARVRTGSRVTCPTRISGGDVDRSPSLMFQQITGNGLFYIIENLLQMVRHCQ